MTISRIAEVILTDAKRAAEEKGVIEVTTTCVDGDIANQILDHAKSLNADCIVMGHRGLGNFAVLFMGSVSNKVSHLAECTCVSVK